MRTCDICHKEFNTNSSYFRHLDSHSFFGGFFCDLCEKNFRREENLVEHWRKACPGVQMFLNPDEQQNLSYQELKLLVIRNIYEYKKIDDTDKPSTSDDVFTDSNTKVCVDCNNSIPIATFARHVQVHNRVFKPGFKIEVVRDTYVIYFCDLCAVVFSTSQSLYDHWRESCNEVMANVPENGVLMSNEELVDLVAHLVDESNIQINIDTKFEFNAYENQSRRLVKPNPWINLQIWKNNSSNLINCPRCTRKFKNRGRMDRHLLSYHNTWKIGEKCLMCLTHFKRKDALIEHLRSVCPAMKLEIPVNSERTNMTSFALLKKMEDCEPRWKTMYEARRSEYQTYVRQILSANDTKPSTSSKPPPLPQEIPDFSVTSLFCPFCDILFKNTNITKRHIVSMHPEKVKDFVDGLPVFFDEFGYEYRIGKYLDIPMKHGTRLKKTMPGGNSEFVIAVEIICRDLSQSKCVVLNETEIPVVFGKETGSKLKMLYEYKPAKIEDLPVLKQER